jgi:hypothetical protein
MIFSVRIFSSLRSVTGLALVLGVLTTQPAPIFAQSLEDSFRDLFRFGDCGGELFCLYAGGGETALAGNAFSTNANSTARNLTNFLQGVIALGIATAPAPSAGSGETFRLSPLGVPVRNEEKSLGPILAERTLTLGRGTFLLGLNVTDIRFEHLRGVSLEDLRFNVVQRDLPPTGLGTPNIEQTYLGVTTRMALDARVTNLFLSYGITDRLDLSAIVPIVQVALSGYSDAEIVIGQGLEPAAGFSFGGFTEDPILKARAEVDQAKATGLGDVSIRGKYRLSDSESLLGLAILAEVGLPTGREEDFLGTPGVWFQSLGIASMELGAGFTPHANAGVVVRRGEGQRDAVSLAFGFDHRTSSRLTVAADFMAQLPLGDNLLVRQEIDILGYQEPVETSNLPTLRDDQLDGSLGVKLRLGKLAVLGNVILPLNDGGLRSDVLWTFGIQGGF